MSVFGAVTGRLFAFGDVPMRLCWCLVQLLGDYVDVWLTYWKIMLNFAQLLGDYVDLWLSY